MHFFITAYDGKDSEALARRMKVREQHLENVKKLTKQGKCLYGAVILDDDGKMVGSTMIVDYPSKEILEKEYLNNEPYVTGDVWREIEIRICKVGDFFLDKSLL
jgi:uncharacterized protein YciI